jgi:drug/metabolite transporter (DMT)-like permease
LSASVTALVLLAALLHACWNAMVKSTGDRMVMMGWIAGTTSLIALPLVFFVEPPSWEVARLLAVAVCIHTTYMLLLISAYEHGDFGQVYPLARGFAPALVTMAGFAMGEALAPHAMLAIGLIIAGIVSLAWRRRPDGEAEPRDLRGITYALGTGLAIASYSVVDGIGGRTAATPEAYVVWLFLLHGLPVAAIAFIRRGPSKIFASRKVALAGMGGAAMSMLAYGIVIWAMKFSPLGPVSALRETSVVFAALISGLVLKEGLGPRALIAACVVAAGVVLLRV